jgi:uncharacterized membrane protein
VASRRRSPQADLISALVAVEEAGEQLTEDELLTTAALLFAAGFETTTNLLANGLVALLQHPSQLALLRDRPELAASAVEELLRFDSPVQLVSRVVMDPIELGGVTVGEGERVVAYLGAGNRDPERFADPDSLRLDRSDNAPLSFGGGIHYCLGAPLARLEAQVALPALVRRFPASCSTESPSAATASASRASPVSPSTSPDAKPAIVAPEWNGAEAIAREVDLEQLKAAVTDLVDYVFAEDTRLLDTLPSKVESALVSPLSVLARLHDVSACVVDLVVACRVRTALGGEHAGLLSQGASRQAVTTAFVEASRWDQGLGGVTARPGAGDPPKARSIRRPSCGPPRGCNAYV